MFHVKKIYLAGGDISPKKLNGLSILKDTQYVIIIGCVSKTAVIAINLLVVNDDRSS